MSDIILERKFDPPLTRNAVIELSMKSDGCFNLHRVDWGLSLLSSDGGKMVCHFIGPDAESVRIALRQLNTDMSVMWPGTVHDRPGLSDKEVPCANVLVERQFDTAVEIDDIQAIEDAGAWCLDAYQVRFIRTYFSLDRKRMICLYKAPDAESVRLAQRQAEMPFEKVWAISVLGPDTAE